MAAQYMTMAPNGETYYVVTDDTGAITEIAGPLSYRDVTAANLAAQDFDSEPEDLGWANDNRDAFVALVAPYAGDEVDA